MALTGNSFFRLFRKLRMGGDGVSVRTLTGDLSLTVLEEQLCDYDPGSASRDVTIHVDDNVVGNWRAFYNSADADGENLVIKNSAGTTIMTVGRGETGVCVYGGSTPAWKKLLLTDGTADVFSTANTWSAEQTFGAGIALLDGDNITLGTGDDDTIGHDGTNTIWTHALGDLVIDNTDVDDQIILRVGTDTSATGVEIRNNSDAAIFSVVPESATTGLTTVTGDLAVTDEVILSDAAAGASAAGRLRRNGTNVEYHDGTASRVIYKVAGTDVAVADGGTGASDAGTARTNLGLVIGTDVQAYDASLASLAALATAADKMVYTTALDTYAEADLTAAGRAILDDASAAAQRTTLGVVIGTDVQAFDATLLSIAALGTAADKIAYTTALDTWAEADLTAAGRALIDDASAAAQRTTLGVVIGTDVQAFDATLSSIAALGTAADKIAYTTGIDTWAEADLTAAGRAILDDASAAAQRTTLGLVIGTDVQAYDAELAALAAAATGLCFCDLQAAAEAGNAIAVTVALKDAANVDIARVQRLHCRLYDDSMLEAVVGAFTVAETGVGTEISTTARPALLVDTDANGDATVTVTDVSGAFAGTVYLEVVPVIVPGSVEPGVPAIIALTFA